MLEELSRYLHHEQQPEPEEFSPEVMDVVKKYVESDIAGQEKIQAYHELERRLPDEAKRKAAIAAYREKPTETGH